MRKPERVAISETVMIVLPSELVMLRTVKDAVKVPVTVVGVVALAIGIESKGSANRASIAAFIFRRGRGTLESRFSSVLGDAFDLGSFFYE